MAGSIDRPLRRSIPLTIARWGIAIIAWAIIAGGLFLTIAPRLLDRIYYAGPVSGHYDGERFFNPDGEDTVAPPSGGSRSAFILSMATGARERGYWPDHVDVTPGGPHPDLTPCPTLAGGARTENWARCARTPPAPDAMAATWVGHATVLIQTPGFAMLTDPIWAERAGPLGIGPRRVTAPGIAIENLPKIDLIVVSHNHYDHLDIATLKALWDRDRPVIITPLGNDTLLRRNGITAVALDWGGSRRVGRATVHVTRNHHWSTRLSSDRNRALWSSFLVDTPAGRVYFAGDTGFGDGRWAGEAAAIPGADGQPVPVRLALLPIGAFRFRPGQMATGSHIGPEQAAILWHRLGQPTAMAIHWGTFRLSDEARDTPPQMLALILRCAGADPSRFGPWPVGQSRLLPAPGAPVDFDERRITNCANTAEVRALP